MSAALEKGCDWSLGFDGRGPVFDEINKDWRHSIFLTGRAARKQVHFASDAPENQRLLVGAMAREWKKWEEHKATLPLTQGELRMLKSRFPNLNFFGTRWVLTPKEPDFKARLVVQSCQEDPSMMRTDSPTGSRDMFLVFSFAAQEHWSCDSADAVSAYLQEAGIERLLLLMIPKRQPPPRCEPGVAPEALLVSQEFAASSLVPMELCGKLQRLQLQSRPDLSYEVNRAAQRSSAPTVADVGALNAISLKARRSSETILRYPLRVIDVSTSQLVTKGDASFANMEGSKNQCSVIVFLTHEPWRFWQGEFQLEHLVYWTSSTIKRVVWSTLAAEEYSVSEAVEEAQWLRSVLTEMRPSVPSSLPRSLRTREMDSLRRPIATLSDSFNLCQAVKSDKGTGSDKWLQS